MNKKAEVRRSAVSSASISPARALEVLRAELAQETKERGHWNEEAGSTAPPDEYEQALALAIDALAECHGLT